MQRGGQRRRIESNDALAARLLADPDPEPAAPFACECSHPYCSDAVVATAEEYVDARNRGARLLSLAHVAPDGGEPLQTFERFAVVR